MVEVRIKFTADQLLFEQSLEEVDEETKEITESLSADSDELIRDHEKRILDISQNLVITDQQQARQETFNERRIRELQESIVIIDNMENQTEVQRSAITVLQQSLDELQQTDLVVAEAQLQSAKSKTELLKIEIQSLLTIISGALGFVALGSALTGQQILGQFTPLVSLAVLSLQQILQLQAIGAISGNLALFAAAGALAASAAATIGTIESIRAQTQAEFDADERRKVNLSEDF